MEAIAIIYIALTVERLERAYIGIVNLSSLQCLGLHNRTLNRSKTDCVYYWEQAVKEAQKIVPGYEAKDYLTPDFPDKPKGMHWKTYDKHRAKYYQYRRKGEDLWLSGIKL